MEDTGSTVGLLKNFSRYFGCVRDDKELARLLRLKLVSKECCQQKLANVQHHFQGKPLHALRFSDVVCCCQEDVDKIAQAHAIAYAWAHEIDRDDAELDDTADTVLNSGYCNVVTADAFKGADYEDERGDIVVDTHALLAECYGDVGEAGTQEATFEDNDEDGHNAHVVVREACTQIAPTQHLWLLQSRMWQSHMKHIKPFSYHHDTDRPNVSHDLLLDVLIRRMPLAQIIAARVVCRVWHEVLTSPECFCLLANNPDAMKRYIIVQTSSPSNPSGLTFYDTVRECWLCTPINLPDLPLLAAAGGLLCFGDNFSSPSWSGVLLVGNPLTQQWKELPPLPLFEQEKGHLPWCGMLADWQEALYKVFVVYTNSEIICIYTYESATGQWGTFMRKHAETDLVDYGLDASLKRSFTLSPQGCLLQVSCEERRILSYSVKNSSFDVVKLGRDPPAIDKFDLNTKLAPYARLPVLLSCGERFFLVGRTTRQNCQVGGRLPIALHGSLGIWKLRIKSAHRYGDWRGPMTEVVDLEREIEGSDGTDFYATTDSQSTIYLFLTGGTTMCAYNVRTRSWTSLPGCPSSHLLNLQGEAYYEPLIWPFPL
ncbi:hypothetical protein L7F22_007430 [Adiantum nelumboides]|nr:hypothetical protein [Adiantum nelumboides]